jgi:hypothetical protein
LLEIPEELTARKSGSKLAGGIEVISLWRPSDRIGLEQAGKALPFNSLDLSNHGGSLFYEAAAITQIGSQPQEN